MFWKIFKFHENNWTLSLWGGPTNWKAHSAHIFWQLNSKKARAKTILRKLRKINFGTLLDKIYEFKVN